MAAHRILSDMYKAPFVVADPGNGGTLYVDRWGAVVPLVSGSTSETRTISPPTCSGIQVFVIFDTDGGGDVVVTVTGGYDQSSATSLTFGDAGDYAMLVSAKEGSSYLWHLVSYEGVSGPTTVLDNLTVGKLRLSDTAWDDLRVTVNSVKVPTVNPPAWADYKGSQVLAFEDQAVAGNEEIVYFSVQMPHSWKEGTDISPHVHWLAEDDTAGNCRWKLTYSWANINGTFATETPIYVDGASGAAADKHVLSAFADIAGAGKTLSSMLLCSLSRNSSHANDTLNGKDAYLLEIDFHYEVDKFGSDNEFTND